MLLGFKTKTFGKLIALSKLLFLFMVTKHLGIFLALACILLTAEKALAALLEGQLDPEGVTP